MSVESEMTPSRRHIPSPSPVPPMDDDDLLSEILVRVPPQPSSLPRASLVCKRWRRLVTDPRFFRRFCAHHRRPPFLGYFVSYMNGSLFTPTLDPPDRIHSERFSTWLERGERTIFLDCRHGRVLLFIHDPPQLFVWDPITGDQQRVAAPPSFTTLDIFTLQGAVLCADGDRGHVHGGCHSSPFNLVFVAKEKLHNRVHACVYSSKTGTWGDTVSLALEMAECYFTPSTSAGGSVYWKFVGDAPKILEFDMVKQSLGIVELPPEPVADDGNVFNFLTVPAKDGGLGIIRVSGLHAQLWNRKADSHEWVLAQTIQLDELPPLESGAKKAWLILVGFAENNDVMFMSTDNGLFMIHLKPVKFEKISDFTDPILYYPFESFYPAGMGVAGGCESDEEDELLIFQKMIADYVL